MECGDGISLTLKKSVIVKKKRIQRDDQCFGIVCRNFSVNHSTKIWYKYKADKSQGFKQKSVEIDYFRDIFESNNEHNRCKKAHVELLGMYTATISALIAFSSLTAISAQKYSTLLSITELSIIPGDEA